MLYKLGFVFQVTEGPQALEHEVHVPTQTLDTCYLVNRTISFAGVHKEVPYSITIKAVTPERAGFDSPFV
jgi:hypothetical protein